MSERVIIFFIFLSLLLMRLFPTNNIKVLNGVIHILDKHKLHIALAFDHYRAIYKKHLMFSFNSPMIKVKKWNLKEEASLEYIHSFRKSKRICFLPFEVELDLEFLGNDKKVLEKCLLTSQLCVSCFALDKTGRTRPENLFINLTSQVRRGATRAPN